MTQHLTVPFSSYTPALAFFNNLVDKTFLKLILLKTRILNVVPEKGLSNKQIYLCVTGISTT